MKKSTILFSLVLGIFSITKVNAQAGAYAFAASSGTYTPVSGGTDVDDIETDSRLSTSLPIGFIFNFDGVDFTTLKASSDGYLSFGTSSSNTLTNDIDNTTLSRKPLLAPFWDDLDDATGSAASYVVTGTSPNRVFTFEWLNWERYNSSSSDPVLSFQVKLYETTNVIEFIYRGESGNISSSTTASIGVSGVSSFLSLDGIGTSPLASNTAETSSLNAVPADGQVYSFTPPTCPASTALSSTDVTSSAAEISWSSGGASHWNIEYGVDGFTPGTGTVVSNVTNPFTISGLTATTGYDFYVQDSCGVGDLSSWSSSASFRTLCDVYSPAYTEDFSSFLPSCWSEAGAGTPSTGPSSIGFGNWSSDGFLNNGSSGAARVEMYNSGDQEWLLTPEFDLSGVNSWELGFDVGVTKWYGTDLATLDSDDEIILLITEDNGGTWDTLEIFNSANSPSNTGDAKLYDLTPYTGVVKFAFWASEGASYGGIDLSFYVDNFDIHLLPDCVAPTALNFSSITNNSAIASWTGGGAANWNIEYGVSGFTPGNGTIVMNVTNPFTVPSLTANTNYDFYVQDSCGTGITSAWINSSFLTLPGAHSFPLIEDFEDNTLLFENETSSDVPWVITTTLVHSGTKSAFNGYSSSDENILHETGILDLSTATAPVVEFWHIAKTEGGYDKCYVEISTDQGLTYTAIPASSYRGGGDYQGYFSEDSYLTWGTSSGSPDNTWWKKETLDLSAYNVAGVRLRFRLTSDGSTQRTGWYVDDVQVYEPLCVNPHGFISSHSAMDSVILNWNAGAQETAWNIEYGTIGFVQGTGTIIATSDTTDTISGLDLGSTYEFYVQANCGGGDFSDWVGPISVSTPITNDMTCAPIRITPNTDFSSTVYSNVGATLQTGEAARLMGSRTHQNTVWFKTVVPASGHLLISTCGSDFTTRLGVYAADTAICDSLETFGEVAYSTSNYNVCSPSKAAVEICGANPGDSLLFYVGGSSSSQNGLINLTVSDYSLAGYAGVGESTSVPACVGDTVNLWNHVNNPITKLGTWKYLPHSAAIIDDSTINTAAMTLVGNEAIYIVENTCDADTAKVLFNVYNQTSSGTALANFQACSNGDVYLFDGISGLVDANGVWNDDTGSGLLNGNKFVANGLPSGAYQFTYTVDNSVCPPSSTQVTVNLVDCTDITEGEASTFGVYPNPNDGTFFITNSKNDSNIAMEVIDVQGKVIYSNTYNMAAGSQQEISLGNVDSGIYLVRIITNNQVFNMNVIVK